MRAGQANPAATALGREAVRSLLEGVRSPPVRAAFYADARTFLRPVHFAARSPAHGLGPPAGSAAACEPWTADRETAGAAGEVLREVLDRNLSLKFWFTVRGTPHNSRRLHVRLSWARSVMFVDSTTLSGGLRQPAFA